MQRMRYICSIKLKQEPAATDKRHKIMKLYHATSIENIEYINEYGLRPSISEKTSNDERLNQEAVYGFDNIDDAIDFITDNGYSSYAVYSFECENPILDTEYESNSYAFITEDYVEATLELIEE